MHKKYVLNFIDKLPRSLRQDQIAKLLYTLKAWKILSNDNTIENTELSYETFYASTIKAKKLNEIFHSLAKSHKLFELFIGQGNILSKISDDDLTLLFNETVFRKDFIPVTDMFYSVLEGTYDYSVSNQIAELGVKLLGSDCDEIYAPFSNSLNLSYYTDKEVYAESMADEFIIELMKIIDGIDINFKYTDTLDEPAYINEDAPHLLRQFSCTLSFPPMGLSMGKALKGEDKFRRFRIHKGRGHRDVAHIEHILAQTKNKAVVLLPVGITYRAGSELELRKHLIENNLLEAIIQLPSNLHNATSIETTFFIINKHKTDENIYFLNLKDKQFLGKDGRKTIISNIDKVLSLYEDKEELEKIINSFLRVLFANKDFSKINAIIDNFNKIWNKEKNLKEIDIISPFELDEESREMINKYLNKKFGAKKFSIKEGIDKSLLGGFIIRDNDKIYDASLKAKINKLKNELKN